MINNINEAVKDLASMRKEANDVKYAMLSLESDIRAWTVLNYQQAFDMGIIKVDLSDAIMRKLSLESQGKKK